MIFQQDFFDAIGDSLNSPPCGPVVMPTVMTFRPGETGARFQLIAANLALQLAAGRRLGLGLLMPVSTTQEPEGRAGILLSWEMRGSA